MKDEKIRRFSSAEIFLHWTYAVLFLALGCTGTLILIYRIFEVEIVRYEILSLTHRIAGVSLIIVLGQTAILSIFVKGFGQLWHTFRQLLRWILSDIVWLAKVPFNMLFKRVTLPPAERFNPGQKLHLLVIFTVLPGFSISGLVIILVPGTLAAWAIHLICFIPTALFLLLHLFLSMINPQTRKSLPAIFTGFISTEYARQHHSLWIETREIKPHGSHVSWRALTLTITASAIIIVFAIRYYGYERAQENIRKLISSQGTTSILPGRLAKSHTDDPQLKYCIICHQSLLKPSSDACLSCHDILQQRIAQQSGFHGKLTGQCLSCHTEHAGEDADIRNFDTTQFDHNLANYELQGKHSKLSCQKCHLVKENEDEDAAAQTKYIGLNFGKCTNCHSDPHLGRFKKACTACHSEDGWKEPYLVFYHNKDTEFEIDQIHSYLACASCHKDIEPPLFKPLPTTCEECHDNHDNIEKQNHGVARRIVSKPDLHTGHATCTECHQTDKQRPKPADYANTCLSCHDIIQQRMAQQSGFHGKLTGQCLACHPEHAGEDADILNFDHNLANYELQGKHSKLSCQKCHLVKEDEDAAAQTKYIGLNFGKCTYCHSDPHLGRFKKACTACHSEDGWKEPYLVFYHNKDTEFAIDQIHSHLACASCHKDIEPPLFKPLATTCEECHDNIEKISHGIASRIVFKPDPHAGRVTCTRCHQTDKQRQKPADYANECKSCHNYEYEQLYHNWNMAFELRKSQAKKLLSRLHQISASKASQIVERITEAEYTGFHNIQLANTLWDQILSEFPNDIRDLEGYPKNESE
ncbi:MAG: cytochrome c3 family protein [Candidatus Brocadiales bacterium]